MSSSEPYAGPEEVIHALCNDDIDKFKKLLPLKIDVCDDGNNNLLHLSVIYEKFDILVHLLSLNHFKLDATNNQGETALELALLLYYPLNICFCQELIKNGASLQVRCYENNTYLHLALHEHQLEVARILIENGACLDVQNDAGCTPMHMLFNTKTDAEGVVEGVAMLLYYGADPSICDSNGNLPFELAVIYGPDVSEAQEYLFYYTFDLYSQYEISSEVFFELLENQSPLFPQIAPCISDVIFVKGVFYSPICFINLNSDFLRVMIDKFGFVISEVFWSNYRVFWYNFNRTGLQNWEMLLNSHLASDTVQFLGHCKIETLIETMMNENISVKDATDFLFYLLSYGLNVEDRDVDCVYNTYGYCDLFKTLLHMDIKPSTCDIMPRLIYDVDIDLDTFLQDPHNYSINAIEKLLAYFARPKLKEFCVRIGVRKLIDKTESLPQVPLLMEFARDATRQHLIKKFDLKSSKELFSCFRWLPVSIVYRKILAFETKLY